MYKVTNISKQTIGFEDPKGKTKMGKRIGYLLKPGESVLTETPPTSEIRFKIEIADDTVGLNELNNVEKLKRSAKKSRKTKGG